MTNNNVDQAKIEGKLGMIKGANKAVAALAATMFLGLSTPAIAGSDLGTDGFESTIARAKSQMMADPATALNLAREAKVSVDGDSRVSARNSLTARWLEGEALMRLNRGDEASSLLDAALAEASASFREEKIYADLLRSAASSKARAGEFEEALTHFELASDRYATLGDLRSRAIVLQNIGSLYSKAREFEKVLGYYRQAAEIFTDEGPLSLSAHNNIGNALRGLEQFDEAEQEFEKSLAIAKKMSSPLLEARILTNLAATQVQHGMVEKAEATAQRALALCEEHAPRWQPFAHGVLAQVELQRGNIEAAESHIAQTFADQPLDKTDALFRDFHDTAAQIYAQSNENERAGLHVAAYERINLQAQELRLKGFGQASR